MDITTPALLFPAISLLLLAYTNRFVVLTNLIRQLSNKEDANSESMIRRQISSLHLRLNIIRSMQSFGVMSFIICTLSMFVLYLQWHAWGEVLFGLSLVLLVISLIYSLYEVHISTRAISIELEKIENVKRSPVKKFEKLKK